MIDEAHERLEELETKPISPASKSPEAKLQGECDDGSAPRRANSGVS